jgi:hypothetical protein
MGTGSFPGIKRPGVMLAPEPHVQYRGLKKGRAIPLPNIRALVDYKGGNFVVVVVLVVGPISTAAMKAYCTLTPNVVPSFISRGAAHQAA